MRDTLVFVTMILAFATAVTAHVAIAVGLLFRHPRWHAPLAFFLAPLAPAYAYRAGMHLRATLWIAAALTYLAAR